MRRKPKEWMKIQNEKDLNTNSVNFLEKSIVEELCFNIKISPQIAINSF